MPAIPYRGHDTQMSERGPRIVSKGTKQELN